VPGKKTHPSAAHATDLSARAERALGEGRSKQALELAKELFRQEPTSAHREMLRRAYLARGRELRERGAERDSMTVLKAALASQGDDPAWLAQLAEQLVLSGAVGEALALVPRLTEPATGERLLGHAADAAVRQGNAGRALLPEAHRADFDRVLQAFALSETGNDNGVREALAGIGLRSPFAEWKLLVRGLLAYYAGEDSRALENWQRLAPGRLPARLAATLRQAIDAPFRGAQASATRHLLEQQFDRLQGSPLVVQLRGLRAALADKDNMAPAFRQAEALLPELRRAAPDVAERLARVFYWAITETSPDDVPRYQRVFGRPAGDPRFDRLQALVYDRFGDLQGAHKHWQKYEKEIAADPATWPAGQAARARALVWVHMGHNAAMIPSKSRQARLPPFIRDVPGAARPLRPSAEECFRRAAELAPDLPEPYVALFDYYCKEGDDDKAAAAARNLLERFPDHVPTLEALGDLCLRRDEQAEALALYVRALRANPLERRLRHKSASAHLGRARVLAVEKSFDTARAQVQAALALQGGIPDAQLLCRCAAVELKAGDAVRAEELLEQARQRAGSDLAVAYRMATEAARLKLSKPLKTRFEDEFAAGLAALPTAAEAAVLAGVTAALAEAEAYTGRKTHQKKVLAYLERARTADFTEQQLQDTCAALLHLDSVRLARHYLERGRKKFHKNPHFPYLEAMSYFLRQKRPEQLPYWKIRPLLEDAERLARALPETEQLKGMLDDLGHRLQGLAALDPLAMDNMFGNLFDLPFDDEEDDSEEYDED
jgi:tetratricopeptide (TPR) repeat protein